MGCLEQSEDDYCDEAVDEDNRSHIYLFVFKVQKQRYKEHKNFHGQRATQIFREHPINHPIHSHDACVILVCVTNSVPIDDIVIDQPLIVIFS